MFRYNANKGSFPKIGDYVEVVNSGIEVDGLKGTVGGWGDTDMIIALISLDEPMEDGRTIVAWPIVCLKKTISEESKPIVNQTFLEAFQSIIDSDFEEKVDEDGYIIWNGGDRPVDKDTIVAVKVRGKVPRSPIAARYWPQITWRHRELGDPMNVWDIIAYKVVK